MPLYEYLCGSCGHRFERIQKFSDAPLSECPSCGGSVEKQLSSPAIQFKGSGWYITDYAKSGSTGKGTTSSPTSDKPAATTSSSGDTATTSASASAPAAAKPDSK